MVEPLNAFVIMPFDPEFNVIYEKLIKESLEEVGFNVTRADSLTTQENILSTIVQGITKANIVVADLTTTNPNVFYELGLCHGLGIPVIPIAQSISEVPFDLRSYRVHVYETHFDKIGKLKDFLKHIGRKHLAGEVLFSNPVKDFSMGSGSAPLPSAQLPTVAGPEPSDDEEPKGLWDFVNDANDATNDLTELLNKLLKATNAVSHKITKHTASMQMLSNNPTAGSARRFQKISLLASSDINAFSQKVEDILPEFENVINRLGENYSGFLNLTDPKTEEDYEVIVDFRTKITELSNGTKDARRGLVLFQDAAIEIEKKRISRDLSRASRRQAEALGNIISNVERVEAFCNNIVAMINTKFNPDNRSLGHAS